ncbi:MAG: hypothetical protein H8D23_12650 [Candidatus Brocadiales bacterium]|nr:hypothetical protein [Candidatus Brocadiales bacterium]
MDTTSHDFQWDIHTIGQYGTEIFDVAYVADDNVWIVGEIATDEQDYNAAHWDGHVWEIFEIWGITPINGIQYFSDNDIWVVGGFPFHWDGNEWTLYHLEDMGITEGGLHGQIWGSSPNDIHFIGYDGLAVHYDGIEFEVKETGTDIRLRDIAGSPDGEHVFAVGFENHGLYSIALEYVNGEWQTIYYSESPFLPNSEYGKVNSVFVRDNSAYFATRAGLLQYNYLTGELNLHEIDPFSIEFVQITRCNSAGPNDVFLVTNNYKLYHYNGDNWILNSYIDEYFGDDAWTRGADMFEDKIAVVGHWAVQTGVIAFGSREF